MPCDGFVIYFYVIFHVCPYFYFGWGHGHEFSDIETVIQLWPKPDIAYVVEYDDA